VATTEFKRAERHRKTAERQAAEARAVREHAEARVAELAGEDG
jgi:hypothetical protein